MHRSDLHSTAQLEPSDTHRAGAIAGCSPWSNSTAPGPALGFIPNRVEKYLEVFKTLLAQGLRNFTIQGSSPEAQAFLAQAHELRSEHAFELHGFGPECRAARIDGLPARREIPDTGAVFFFLPSGPALTAALMEYAGARNLVLCAPITEHYFTRRPLLIQSIPKCGTHLLFEVAKAMGYHAPPTLDLPGFAEELLPGHFYNLQHLRLEALGRPYAQIGPFVEAFSASPIPFIYRDPRDVAVSMAHYLVKQKDYHLLSSYMESLSAADRLSAVIGGEYPIPIFINRDFSFRGTIRDLMMEYAGWLNGPFRNVLPIRFEDIVGTAGGACEETQLQVLWQLQLAWHVPGRPGDFVSGLFNKRSMTFRKGTIGSYQDEFQAEHHRLFQSLPQDFMRVYGYGGSDGPEHLQAEKKDAVSSHRCSGRIAMEPAFARSPYLLEEGYRGFNIVRFERQYIGVAQELGDIGAWPAAAEHVAQWTARGTWIAGNSCNEVRSAIDDRRIRGLEARIKDLEDALQETDGLAQYLLEDLRAVHHRLSVRGHVEAARRLIAKVNPLSRLWRFFSRRGEEQAALVEESRPVLERRPADSPPAAVLAFTVHQHPAGENAGDAVEEPQRRASAECHVA